jgi:hypothetical protein
VLVSLHSLQAARVADQNAKLSIFATRPAIYAPLYNFLTETMGTVALILLALLIELQVGGACVSSTLTHDGFESRLHQAHQMALPIACSKLPSRAAQALQEKCLCYLLLAVLAECHGRPAGRRCL